MRLTPSFTMLVAIAVVLLFALPDPTLSSALSRQSAGRLAGPACVPYRGSPATQGKCDHVIFSTAADQPLNVFLTDTYDTTDANAANKTTLMNAFFPAECRNALLALTCMGSFLRCEHTEPPQFNVYPPCRSVCESVLLSCTPFFAAQGMMGQLPDCDMIVPDNNGNPVPAYPPDGTQCVTAPAEMHVPYSDVDCPYPLKYNYDEESSFAEAGYPADEMCVLPCPNPMWTDAEWTGGLTVMMVLSFCSFLLSGFVLVSLCLMPGKRRYPASLFSYIVLCSLCVSFNVFFYAIISGGPTRLVCTRGNPPVEVSFDNAREHDGAGVPCILQAMGIVYFALAGNFWWLALCLNVFEMIFLRKSIEFIRKFHIFYHLAAWGLPLIAVIICLGGTAFGAQPATPYCFITGNEWWSWSLFHFPIGITLVVGTVLMTMSVGRMILIRSRGIGRGGQTIEQSIRLMLLIVAYWLLLLYPWAFRIYTRVIEDDLEDATEEQVRCSASTGSQCEASMRIDVGTWYLMLIDLSCHGFIIFACLASMEVLRFWTDVVRILYTTPFRAAIHDIRDMIVDGGNEWKTSSQHKSSQFSDHKLQSQSTLSSTSQSDSKDDSML